MAEDDVSPDKQPKPLSAALDPQRDEVMEHLQAAFADGTLNIDELDERLELAQAAESERDLEMLLEDVPGHAPLARRSDDRSDAPSASTPPSTREGALQLASDLEPLRLTAIFGSAEKEGRWNAPPEIYVKAIFGGAEVDLRDARLGPVTTIHCNAVFGGIEIELPDDVRVESTGMGILGGFGGKRIRSRAPADAPLVRISGNAVFGGVTVKQKRRRERERRRRRDSSDEYPAVEKRRERYDSDEYESAERKRKGKKRRRRDSSDEYDAVKKRRED